MGTEDDEEHEEEGSTEGEGKGEGGDKGTKSFSQDEVNDIAAKARSKARRQATAEILEAFGVSSVDELKATVAKLKDKPSKTGSGDGKPDTESAAALEAAVKRAEKAEETLADLRAKDFETRKREALMEHAGVPLSQAKRIAKMLDVEDDADDDELKAEVRQLQKDMPLLFKPADQGEGDENEEGNGQGQPRRPVPTSTSNPGRGPRPARKPEDARTAATSRLHLRHPQLKKKSTT